MNFTSWRKGQIFYGAIILLLVLAALYILAFDFSSVGHLGAIMGALFATAAVCSLIVLIVSFFREKNSKRRFEHQDPKMHSKRGVKFFGIGCLFVLLAVLLITPYCMRFIFDKGQEMYIENLVKQDKCRVDNAVSAKKYVRQNFHKYADVYDEVDAVFSKCKEDTLACAKSIFFNEYHLDSLILMDETNELGYAKLIYNNNGSVIVKQLMLLRTEGKWIIMSNPQRGTSSIKLPDDIYESGNKLGNVLMAKLGHVANYVPCRVDIYDTDYLERMLLGKHKDQDEKKLILEKFKTKYALDFSEMTKDDFESISRKSDAGRNKLSHSQDSIAMHKIGLLNQIDSLIGLNQ